jgi:hypothetical protein
VAALALMARMILTSLVMLVIAAIALYIAFSSPR